MSVVNANFVTAPNGQVPQVGQAYEVPITWTQTATDLACNLHMTRVQNLVFIESGPLAGPDAAGDAIIATAAATLLPVIFRPNVERNIPICVSTGAGPIVYSMGNLKILPTGAMEVGFTLDPVTSTVFPQAAPSTFTPRGAYSISGLPLPQP